MANMKMIKATQNDEEYQTLQSELAKLQVKEMQDQTWYPEQILEIQTKIDFRYSEIKRNLEISEGKCQAGCQVYTGDEVRHDKNCIFYPESFTKMYDDLLYKTTWRSVHGSKPEERSLLKFLNGLIVIGFYKQSMNAYFIERADISEPQTVSANREVNPVVEWRELF